MARPGKLHALTHSRRKVENCIKRESRIVKILKYFPRLHMVKRSKKLIGSITGISFLLAIAVQPGSARMSKEGEAALIDFNRLAKTATAIPRTQNRSHRVGNVWMTITNWGLFGSQFRSSQLIEQEGPYSGSAAPSFEFPAGSGLNYLFWGGLWFGAVVEGDTLVSTGVVDEARIAEFLPTAGPDADIIERSNRQSSAFYDPDAISEQEYIAEYTDTLTDPSFVAPDPFLQRRHQPIGLKIRQTSYSWAYDYAQDFVLIDFIIQNISDKVIEKSYMGLFIDADCLHELTNNEGATDDYSGYLHTVPSPYPGLLDTINIAWTADNDGDPSHGVFDQMSPLGIAGTRVVRGPARQEGCGPAPMDFSFNWWTRGDDARFDWGPRKIMNNRNFGTGGEGTPRGDLNKYFIMSNGEFDYDQLYSAIDFSDSTDWLPPRQQVAGNIADGTDTRYLFSFGPLDDILPGDSTYVTMAYVGGDGFHVAPDDFQRFFNPDNPQAFYDNLDFSDFALNAQWSAWVFDNPGVDTDNDGCRGLYSFAFCRDTIIVNVPPTPENPNPHQDTLYENCDTVWYAGDGVPDFKGPPPPPSPSIDITAAPGELTIRWTGEFSETTTDYFTFKNDFEGYRVYIAEMNALSAFAMVASWDIVDYKRLEYDRTARRWVQRLDPIPLAELLEMYNYDDSFDPDNYSSRSTPYRDRNDSLFYFLPQDWNRGNKYFDNGFVVDNMLQYVQTDSLFDDATQSYKRFGHYECKISNLLPSQPYYVAVTAFDYGNLDILAPLEDSPLTNSTPTYASYSSERAAEQREKVVVYPNPYKISANYRGRGYEDRERLGWGERSRRIHFINLPAVCTIKIFTIDGDLVREIHHPDSRLSDTQWHSYWDLITRNTQAAVSGIYLYSVESEYGTQVGKIVIIK